VGRNQGRALSLQSDGLEMLLNLVRVLVNVPGADMKAELRNQGGDLYFYSDYDQALVSALKASVPATDRRWDKANKTWIITPQYGAVVVNLAKQYLNVDVQLPLILNQDAKTTRLLKMEYLGATKDRGNGERTAFGWVDGDWNAIFPERVLLSWFDGTEARAGQKHTCALTLYAALGIKAQATVDEIKSAYRRMARQWHPDVCKEPDAKERFIQIQRAYEVLSNDLQRRKYDAGLALERSLKPDQRLKDDLYGYRAPLLCGWILCSGLSQLGRFVVEHIVQWEDILDAAGRVMVSSWPKGADHFVVSWV